MKRVEQAVDLDLNPGRNGGDLVRLLKPTNMAPSKKNLLATQAYLAQQQQQQQREAAVASQFEISPLVNRALPEGIQIAIANAECDATMGLFCEIHRVWVIVDNLLFLWDYTQPGNAYETYSNKKNNQLLVSVSLCKPKADFSSSSTYQGKPDFLLVLTTFIDVTLLRLDRTGASWLIQDTGIACNTDGTMMRQTVGTTDGRIFLAGENGSLYELVYETKRNMMHRLGIKRQCFTLDCGNSGKNFALTWLVPPVVQTVMESTGLVFPADPLVSLYVDNSRKLLYALSKRGKLLMFALSTNSQGDKETALVSQFDFSLLTAGQIELKSVSLVGVKDLDLKTFEVSSVNVVHNLASGIHLVVIGKNGIRIYFTTCESLSALLTSKHRQQAGKRLNVVAIRAPPDFTKLSNGMGGFIPAIVPQANTTLASYSNSQISLLANAEAVTLLAISLQSTSPQMWTLEDGLREYVEQIKLADLGGNRIFAVEEVARSQNGGGELLNELVSQYGESRPSFLVLTNTGVRSFTKNRPVEVLKLSLERIDKGSVADEFAKQFFRRFGLDEACCMALYLASTGNATAMHNPVFMGSSDWSHFTLASKANHVLSQLGFLLPIVAPLVTGNGAVNGETTKLPELKSKLDQDRDTAQASEDAFRMHQIQSDAAAVAVANPLNAGNRAMLINTNALALITVDAAEVSPDMVEKDTYFSGCFQGLVLLMGRLFRPFWKQSLLSPTNKEEFRFGGNELNQFLLPLTALKQFMESKHPFHEAVTVLKVGGNGMKHWTPKSVEDLRTKELYSLLQKTCEALQLLIEVQTRAPHASLRKQLCLAVDPQLTTFCELVTDVDGVGQRIARGLINASCKQLKEMEEEDLLQRLGAASPAYFSAAHYSFLRALQMFTKMDDNAMASSETKLVMLTKALDLTKASLEELKPEVVLDRIAQIAAKLKGTEHVWRLVDLCAKPEAYLLCFDAIAQTGNLPPAQKRAWDQVFQHPTVQFRYFFFQRWIELGQVQLFFDLVTTLGNERGQETVELFLRDEKLNPYHREDGHAQAHLELYAKWLVRVGRAQEASQVYLELAKIDLSPNFRENPPLRKRNEYLNNALVSCPDRINAGLTRELALFKCRMGVYDALQTGKGSAEDLERLNYCLVNETELLNKFASKYELWEECIAIIQSFGKQDAGAIKMLGSLYGALTQTHLVPRFATQELIATVARLAARFGNDPVVFPLKDLVASLERTKHARFGDEGMEEDEESPPPYNWLAEAVLESQVVPHETLYVAYVRYLEEWCETEAQYANGLRVLLYICREWRARDAKNLASKVHSPLSGEDRDLHGLGLDLLIAKLPNQEQRQAFLTEVQALKLDELVQEYTGLMLLH
ncbi:hypothetical protein BASA81_009127 [Batrachochytrium salamandrivorans]|nr:hypothetical protein BASA81_009127 [Batrachochytrium salamandrivorans]